MFNVVRSQRCEIRRRRMMLHYNTPYHITLTEWTRDTCISDEFSWHQQRTFGIGWGSVHLLFWFTHYSNRCEESMSLNTLQVRQATLFNKTWIWSRLTTVPPCIRPREVHQKWQCLWRHSWPARSPHLSACNFFLWGYLDRSVSDTFGRLSALKIRLSDEINALCLVMSAKWKVL
jgi:hypothetical protein